MATLSINQAAKTFKKGRNTIQAMLKSGEISRSAEGEGIEFSELLRVFGEPSHDLEQPAKRAQAMPESRADTKQSNSKPMPSHAAEHAQAIELAILKERINGLNNVIDEKNKLLEEREKLVLLLTHTNAEATQKTEQKKPAEPIKKSLWEKLFY